MKKRLARKLLKKRRLQGIKKQRGVCGVATQTHLVPVAAQMESETVVRPADVAIIYRSELDYISRCILDRTHIETGGQLFGFWTGNGVPVVLFAIGPGPRANHQVAFFNQDVNYLLSVGRILVRKYGLQHIGEWHSHHQLGLARPSGHDATTMVNNIKRGNLGKFLLSIGNCTDTESTLNAFTFTQTAGFDYVHAAWEIKEVESPFRVRITSDPELQSLVCDPTTKQARHGKLLTTRSSFDFVTPTYAQDYWLKVKAHNLVLKSIMNFLSARSPNGRCAAQLDGLGQVHLSLTDAGEAVRVVFVAGFPETPPLVTFDSVERSHARSTWDFNGDILSCFKGYYMALKGDLK